MSSADKVFEALASLPRRRILAYVSEGPLSAGDIAARFEMSQPAVSKHLAVLEGAGLVWKKREGTRVFYGMERENLAGTLATFLQAVCPPSRALKKEVRVRKDVAQQEG
jgi:ArsR family transcriptional regulator, arsenate/arsenite/antimonite-responsive transcriptional repressor